MKKYLPGLFAIVLAIGFTAFTRTTKEGTTTVDIVIFGLNAVGDTYERIGIFGSVFQLQGDCTSETCFQDCIIAYKLTNEPEAASYPVGCQPRPDFSSGDHGWYDPQ